MLMGLSLQLAVSRSQRDSANVAYADDVASAATAPVGATPDAVLAVSKILVHSVVSRFRGRGLRINAGPGKSEGLIIPAGPGSTTLKRQMFGRPLLPFTWKGHVLLASLPHTSTLATRSPLTAA